MEKIYKIGIDHGYGNIKTTHHIFESGIIQRIMQHNGRRKGKCAGVFRIGTPFLCLYLYKEAVDVTGRNEGSGHTDDNDGESVDLGES